MRYIDTFKTWYPLFLKSIGMFFGSIGAIATVLPVEEITSNLKLWLRIVIFFAIVAISGIVSIIIVVRQIRANRKAVYSNEDTKIYFEYGDVSSILKKKHSELITIVVPANTRLEIALDRSRFPKNASVHSLCLDYISRNAEHKYDASFINDLTLKKDGFRSTGRIGDWFLLPYDKVDRKNKINFLFVEIYETEIKNGKLCNADIDDEQFVSGVQALIDAIIASSEIGSKIYMPLIGSGEGKVRTGEDMMHFINALLRFNRHALRQEIHVLIYNKRRKELPLYHLLEY